MKTFHFVHWLFLINAVSLIECYQNSIYEIETLCGNSSIELNLSFAHAFQGVVHTEGYRFHKNCSYAAFPDSSASNVSLSLPYNSCGIAKTEMLQHITVSTILEVLYHPLIPTIWDTIHYLSCNVSTMHEFLFTDEDRRIEAEFNEDIDIFSWMDVELGYNGFIEEPTVAQLEALFLTFNVLDGGKNRDISVRGCVAHDEQDISNTTHVYQMSNWDGCTKDSDMLSDFTLSKTLSVPGILTAFARIKNVSIILDAELYITCGVKLCKTVCKKDCNFMSEMSYDLSSIAVKKIDLISSLDEPRRPLPIDDDDDDENIKKREVIGYDFNTTVKVNETKSLKLRYARHLIFPEASLRNSTELYWNFSDYLPEDNINRTRLRTYSFGTIPGLNEDSSVIVFLLLGFILFFAYCYICAGIDFEIYYV